MSALLAAEVINAMQTKMVSAMFDAAQATIASATEVALRHAEQRQHQAIPPAGTVIVAPPPVLAAGSSAAPPIRGYTRRNVHIAMPTVPKAKPVPAKSLIPDLSWLDKVPFFIPKSIREPFLGDLREDLADMAANGHSLTAVRWAAISQVLVLVIRWLWSNLVVRR
jgi:hypothetical protein